VRATDLPPDIFFLLLAFVSRPHRFLLSNPAQHFLFSRDGCQALAPQFGVRGLEFIARPVRRFVRMPFFFPKSERAPVFVSKIWVWEPICFALSCSACASWFLVFPLHAPVDLGVIQDSCAGEVPFTVADRVPSARVFFDLVVRLLLSLLVSASALWCSK
jgi:hypothetical protein